jgi:hypothetical protein
MWGRPSEFDDHDALPFPLRKLAILDARQKKLDRLAGCRAYPQYLTEGTMAKSWNFGAERPQRGDDPSVKVATSIDGQLEREAKGSRHKLQEWFLTAFCESLNVAGLSGHDSQTATGAISPESTRE